MIRLQSVFFFCLGKRTRNRHYPAVCSEIVVVKYDIGTVGILESLIRLDCFSENIGVDDTHREILDLTEDIGEKNIFAVLFDHFTSRLESLDNKVLLLFLPGLGAIEIDIAVDPYRQMLEVLLHDLVLIGHRLIQMEGIDPLLICRILIKDKSTCFLLVKESRIR